MPYRFKPGETVPNNIRRIVAEEVDSAVSELRSSDPGKRDVAIHEARKSIKKLRGVLRLIRPELGEMYRAENNALRDIGRKLSALRDASAIIETFGGTLEKHQGKLQKNSLASIRKGLELDKQEKERSQDVVKLLGQVANSLAALNKRASKWPLEIDGFEAIAAGLGTTYRRGRKAMRRAEKTGNPELYHEWRKRAKDHWYHVRLLESLWTETMKARENSLHELETWLGDDHNLVVLLSQLKDRSGRYGDDESIKLFATLAQAQQKQMREDSLSLGMRLYQEKPRRFVTGICKLWNAWQQQPDGIRDLEKSLRKGPDKRTFTPRPRRAR